MAEKLLEALFGKNWGPKLFLTVLVISLVFFWWLLIYSHGVTPHGA